MIKNVSLSIPEDQLILKDSLANALGAFEDINIVGAYTTYQSTMTGLQNSDVDIAVIDISLGDRYKGLTNYEFALSLLEYINTSKLKTKIIVLSDTTNPEIINHTVKSGAASYLLKNVSINTLKIAIDSVYEGETFFPRKIKQMLLSNKKEQILQFKLSHREKEVLKLVSVGFSTPNIAEQLNLHKDTISDYRESLMKKLRAKNAADLVRLAYEHKLL